MIEQEAVARGKRSTPTHEKLKKEEETGESLKEN